MPSRSARRLTTLLGALLSVSLFVLMVRTAPLGEVWAALGSVRWPWIVVGFLSSLAGLLVRGLRWQLLLETPEGAPPLGETTALSSLGLAVNNVLPGKAGELTRIAEGSRRFRTGLGFTAATVVLERIFDAAVLLVLVAVGLLLSPPATVESQEVLGSSLSIAEVRDALLQLTAALGVLFLLLLGLGLGPARRAVVSLLQRIPGSGERLASFAGRQLEQTALALRIVRDPWRLVRVSLATLLAWAAVLGTALITAVGMDTVDLGLAEALVFTGFSVLASAVPSVPGGWGLYEAGGLLAFALTGSAGEAPALAFAFTVHAILYGSVVGAGAAAALWLGRRSGTAIPRGG